MLLRAVALILAIAFPFSVGAEDAYTYGGEIIQAARYGQSERVKVLIQNGADVFRTDYFGNPPLVVAAQAGHTATALELIRGGSPVDIATFEKFPSPNQTPLRTALWYAAGSCHTETVEMLIRNRANVNLRGQNGSTPLMNAIRGCGDRAAGVVEALMEAGTDLSIKDNQGFNALALAERGTPDRDIVAILTGKTIEENESNLRTAALFGQSEKLRALIEKQNPSNEQLLPLLVETVAQGQKESALALIRAGADVNGMYRDQTPLGAAAGAGYTEVVRMLIEQGANLEGTDSKGRTPLFRALDNSSVSWNEGPVRELIQAGANLHVRDRSGFNPAIYIASLPYTPQATKVRLVQLLLQNGADPTGTRETLLVSACRGDKESARALIREGINVNYANLEGETPLMVALSTTNQELIALLIDSGADLNLRTEKGSPLSIAAGFKISAPLKKLIASGANVKGEPGGLALRAAATAANCLENVELLLQAGADVNAADQNGSTPLLCAAQHENAKIIEMLLNAKADPNAKTKAGETSLDLALKNRQGEIVRLLRKSGAVPLSIPDEELKAAAANKDLLRLQMLIYAGGDVNIRGGLSGELLNAAIDQHALSETVKLLIKAGADPNVPDAHGLTPLSRAIQYRNEQIVDILIEAGARVNAGNNRSTTLLDACGMEGINPEIVRSLLRAGASVRSKDSDGLNAVQLAARKGNEDVIRLLKNAHADHKHELDYLLLYASEKGKLRTARRLIEKGANVQFLSPGGESPLDLAVREKQFEIVHLLAEKGANVNLSTQYFDPPLFSALWRYRTDSTDSNLVQILIDAHANVNFKLEDGFTPLMAAAGNQVADDLEILIEAGAKVDLQDREGKSALDIALSSKNAEIVRLLVNAGAKYSDSQKDEINQYLEQSKVEVPEDVKSAVIRLDNFIYSVEISGDGDVVYSGKTGNIRLIGTFQYKIPVSAVRKMVEKLQRASFLDSGYSEEREDTLFGPPTLFFELAGKSNQAASYELFALVNSIERLSGAYQWIHASGEFVKRMASKGQDFRQPGLFANAAFYDEEADFIRELLKAGCNVNDTDKDGYTALMAAANMGDAELAATLLAAKADIQLKDKDGATALSVARKEKHVDVEQLLLKSGASE